MPVLPLLAGFASVVLLYIVGAKLFANTRDAMITAAVLALTPLLWYQLQRQPTSLYALPFVAGWLAAVACSDQLRAPLWSAVAGALLGLGMYGSHAAWVMMPVYLCLTVVVIAPDRITSRASLAFAGAFVLAGTPLLLSIVGHPDDFRRTVTTYHMYDAYRLNLLQGAHEMASWVSLTARSETYYDYFNPTFLFLTGRVLLFPLVVLLPAGLYRILIHESTPMARLSAAGFLAAPLAASLTAERPAPERILFLTTFAAVVSVYGLRQLLSLRKTARA